MVHVSSILMRQAASWLLAHKCINVSTGQFVSTFCCVAVSMVWGPIVAKSIVKIRAIAFASIFTIDLRGHNRAPDHRNCYTAECRYKRFRRYIDALMRQQPRCGLPQQNTADVNHCTNNHASLHCHNTHWFYTFQQILGSTSLNVGKPRSLHRIIFALQLCNEGHHEAGNYICCCMCSCLPN